MSGRPTDLLPRAGRGPGGPAAGEVKQAVRHALTALGACVGELLPGLFDECVIGPRGDLNRDCVDLRCCSARPSGGRGAGGRSHGRPAARPLGPAGGGRIPGPHRARARGRGSGSSPDDLPAVVETLDHELGVAPDDATTSLIEDLVPRPERDGVNAMRRDRARAAPFIGRRPELEAITSQWRDAAAGESGLALVVGESGVGKSRLVRELRARSVRRGVSLCRRAVSASPAGWLWRRSRTGSASSTDRARWAALTVVAVGGGAAAAGACSRQPPRPADQSPGTPSSSPGADTGSTRVSHEPS